MSCTKLACYNTAVAAKKQTAEQRRIALLKVKFLKYYRKLPNQHLAGAYVGRTDDTISIWKRNDSEFSEKIAEAKAQWALENVEGVKSKEWLLERVLREQFSPRQEITGKDGKDLPIPILKVVTDVPRDDSDKKDTETN